MIETNKFVVIFYLQILSRCPACLQNFMQLYCQMTCSPDQNKFMVPGHVTSNGDVNTAPYIDELYYVVAEKFGDGMFQSCHDVQNPSSGKKALDMICGQEADKCTIQTWLDFMGDKSKNPMVPFTIHFVLSANGTASVPGFQGPTQLHAMTADTKPCNESCNCQDCVAKCSPVPPDTPSPSWTIGGYDAMYVIMFAVFAGFIIIFGTIQIFMFLHCPKHVESCGISQMRHHKLNGDSDTEEASVKSHRSVNAPGCYDRLQANFEALLTRIFAAWGRLCARHPIVVIVVCVVVCVVLIVGISFVKVTTDPVELWSAPDSRARLEKNYFDENFG
jgi:Niemann-Pick C1 protein